MNSSEYFSPASDAALGPETVAIAPPSLATEQQQHRIRVVSILAILAIFSSLTPMPQPLTSNDHRDTDSTAMVPPRSARPSVLSFTVNAVHSQITTTTNNVVQQVQQVQTQLWPSQPTGRAWMPLAPQVGWSDQALFGPQHPSLSLVTKAVGAAEGTRRPDGGKNKAYFGHVDPGNAVWNVGTFSYQHCGTCSPAEADRRQLARLKRQFAKIQAQAQGGYGMQLTLEEQLNAIDLANQAPLAALSKGGFIDRLSQAKQQGLAGSDAILQARVYSYKNPITNRWEAPGLGNTKPRIIRDQARRQEAIARAIQLHRQ